MNSIRYAFAALPLLVLAMACEDQKGTATTPTATASVASTSNNLIIAAAVTAMPVATSSAAAVPKAPVLPPAEYDLDVSHTKIGFSVRHMMVSNTRGEFKVFTGKANIDQGDLSKMSLSVDIDVASIDTGDKKRDAHLNTAEFFDTKAFPKMTFKSTKVEADGEGYKVTGDLTIKGVTKSVLLKVDPLSAEMKGLYGGFVRGTRAVATINRTDFGLKYNAAIEAGGVAIGEEVKLEFDIELSRKGDAAPAGSASAAATSGATAAPKASAPAPKPSGH